ncbi:hypothetical protein Hanom_Chr12g01075091 [Helianthus anomalus]
MTILNWQVLTRTRLLKPTCPEPKLTTFQSALFYDVTSFTPNCPDRKSEPK